MDFQAKNLYKEVRADEETLQREPEKGGVRNGQPSLVFCCAMVRLVDHPDEARAMGMRGREYAARYRNYGQTADMVESPLFELVCEPVQY